MDVRDDLGEDRRVTARIAKVLIPLPLPEAFDYLEGEAMALKVGDLVAAPLGPRLVAGVVTEVRPAAGGNRALKPLAEKLDEPPLPATTVAFVEWAARYAVEPPGQALAIALRGLRVGKPMPERRLQACGPAPARLTAARARVLEAAREPLRAGELARAARVSGGVVRALARQGALGPVWVRRQPETPARAAGPPQSLPLDEGQSAAADSLRRMVGEGAFRVALLDGVTGSGKTEVYMEAVSAALARDDGGQTLVLIPEIALTQAVIDRFARRFGFVPAEWHSGLSAPRRRQVWEAVARGEARIVVGARSALFLPYRRLRLIVVDEEHDGAYKQEEGFIYQARDMAVARARIEGAAVVLASATPSLETLWNAAAGRYRWLRLPDRYGGSRMPRTELIDLRTAPPPPGNWLSPVLAEAVGQTLADGEQALLFLNRRGYAPLVLCRACGERLKSPDTDSWLVEHRYSGRLVCHLTGFSMPKPSACPHCAATGSLASIGPGVERIEEEARRLFPHARVAVFSSDTVPDAASARALIGAVAAGEIDILIATQAAAKGHDFPKLTLVGVVDADLGLRGGDLRAAERTFQLITQVAGRAGRRERPGRALLQTFAPDHAVMKALAAGDRDAFVEIEMAEREAAGLPPFTRLAALIVSGADARRVEAYADRLAAAAPHADSVDVFGPADPPFATVRGRRRKRLLVRAARAVDLQGYLAAWRERARPPSSVRLVIDVDPYSFL